MKTLSYFLALILCSTAASAVANQNPPDVRHLFSELSQPKTTDAAAQRILELASKDPKARQYVTQRLAPVILDRASDQVWLNAVRLAGSLKASETISALIRALSRGTIGQGTVSLGEYMSLKTDVVARALSLIGDPAVPEVTKVLKNADPNMRQRAVLILANIDSLSSRRALQEHLGHESDPKLKDLIASSLHQ